jgi:hypothetical protein
MFDFIREFIDTQITELNTGFSTDEEKLSEITVTFDMDKLPANQMHRYYNIRFNTLAKSDVEYNTYPVEALITFTFGLYKKDITEYEEIIDTYIYPLMALLDKAAYDSGIAMNGVKEMNVTALNEIVKLNYLQPVLSFKTEVTVA